MIDRDDDPLRLRFHALAGEDDVTAPPFRVPARATRGRWPATRLAYAAAAVLAVAGGAGYAWRALRPGPPYPIDLSAVTWNGPTDFLLDTPGASLLRELPRIGTAGAPGPEPGLTDDTSRRNRS
jgi:hypothetical protein